MVIGSGVIMVVTTGDSHLEQPHLFLGQWCLAIHNQPVPFAAPVPVLGCCAQGWKEVTARYTLPFLVTESLY